MRPQVTGLSQRRRGGGCDWRPRAPHTARGHGDWSLTPQERSLLRVAQTREGNAMDDDRLRWSITRADTRRLSRRQLIEGVAALGLSAQLAAQWLATTGMARAETREPAFTPTRRGGGGAIKVLMPAPPMLLNPWLALGWPDLSAGRIFYEPLASFGPDGTLVPILAREIPSVQNGGVSRDALWVTWKLKPGVFWHDGKPFTADDVVFNWEYAADPATATPRAGTAQELQQV